MSIRMVCFDAGGVLVRICRSWEEGCAAVGLDVRPRDDSDDARRRRRALNADYQSGKIECEAFFAAMADTSGGAYTADEIRRVHHAWIVDEYAGVRELIRDIRETGKAMTGLLSNTNAAHWEQMSRASMAVFDVDHAHASHLLGFVKPDEAIFRTFEERSGFAAHEILLFDDLEANIEGAQAAGWRTRLIDHEGDTAAQMRMHLGALGLV